MCIVQNLFHRGKHHRTISLNAHYMVLFKNQRDVSQIMALAHQMYPR
jgi:UDP-N-acetyl-D-mannosaminuronic acid transferase (WecB/TagA/CpsF family)